MQFRTIAVISIPITDENARLMLLLFAPFERSKFANRPAITCISNAQREQKSNRLNSAFSSVMGISLLISYTTRMLAMKKWIILFLLLPMIALASNHSKPQWTYNGSDGPSHWGQLTPAYKTCGLGKYQSPVNIRTSDIMSSKGKLVVHYSPERAQLQRGHNNIKLSFMNQDKKNYINFHNKKYYLKNLHFHTPSEHMIDRKAFPMVAHLVNKSQSGELLVLAVLFQYSDLPNKFFQELLSLRLPQQVMVKQLGDLLINPNRLIPKDKAFYTYSGSLTTPPCSENVTWVVMKQPVSVTPAQVKAFQQRVIASNARPVQPLNGRKVAQVGSSTAG